MKKGIVNLVVFIFTLIFVVATCFVVFRLIPKYVHTDGLIDIVTEKLKIDLTDNGTTYKPDDLVNYPITFDKKRTIPLKVEEGEKAHYIEIDGYTLVLNSNAKNYKKKKKIIKEDEEKITSMVMNIIQSYDEKEVSRTKITTDIIKKLKEYLESDVVVRVTLTDYKHK